MKLTTKKLIELKKDLEKTEKVFKSCENHIQGENALKYYELMRIKYYEKYLKKDIYEIFSPDVRLIFNEFKKIYEKNSWKTKNNYIK